MTTKKKKVQIALAAIDSESQSIDFLLLQTNQQRGSFWQNVTGGVDSEETFDEGALREAKEETGLNIDDIVDIVDLKLTFEFVDQWKNQCTEKCFLIITDKRWDVKIDPSEHMNYKWVHRDEIHEGIVKFSSNFETLQKAQVSLRHWGV